MGTGKAGELVGCYFRGVLVEVPRWSDGVEGECSMTIRENSYGVGFPWTVS